MTRYDPTDEGLQLMRLAGVEPEVAWSALVRPGRLMWPLDDERSSIYGQAVSGEYVIVGVREAADGAMEVTGARRMDADEIAMFERRRWQK
jgi:hypothetical protein